MTPVALALIAASVLLHALWHFISKKNNPHLSFFLPVSLTVLVMCLPMLAFAGAWPWALPPRILWCALGGGFCGVFCDLGLSYAYRFSEISLAYPMARALPVLFTAFVTWMCGIGKTLSPAALAGMGVIFAGCILLPQAGHGRIRLKTYWNKGVIGIFAAALGTTGYTVFDGMGVQATFAHLPEAGSILPAGAYSCLRETALFAIMLLTSLATERKLPFREIFGNREAYLAGVSAGLAYLLVLIAMNHVTNISYVQAFRQLSLPVGVLFGVVFLKERVGLAKAFALALIFGGLAAVYLG